MFILSVILTVGHNGQAFAWTCFSTYPGVKITFSWRSDKQFYIAIFIAPTSDKQLLKSHFKYTIHSF